MIKKKGKKANILAENIVFIVLNLIFLSILIIFLYSQIGSAAVLEEKYAKQISLIIDSARPEMVIHLNMEDAFDIAEKNKWPKDKIVSKNQNIITVKLRENRGYDYSFFNDVNVNINPDLQNREYYFTISKKLNVKEPEG